MALNLGIIHLGATELVLLVSIAYLIYHYFIRTSTFWADNKVNGPKPIPFFGNLKDVMFLRLSIGDLMKQYYLKYTNEPLVGFYGSKKPLLLVRDLDFIKEILIKDFTTFSGRGMKVNERADPLALHLLTLEPEKWRPLRNKLSPAFTSGKLKDMFYILIECAEHLDTYIEKIVAKNEPTEVRELTAKYTTDVIGNCAFGLQMNALADEDSEFRKMGREVFKMNWFKIIKFRIRTTFPFIYDLFAPLFYEKEITEFFVNCIRQTIDHREKNNIRRHDFVDLLRDIKDHPDKVDGMEMTDVVLAAQAFVFFVAGFETSSTTMSNALYELAQHHSIQDKLREEIIAEFKRNNGTLKYESIKDMKFMHKVFQETLRKYPPGHILMRKAYAPYTFSGTNITIPKGQSLFISTYGIHYDPSIYPKPEIFDPERFDEEAVQARHPMSYLPFGDGPRNCIGARFAVFQTKIGLAYILRKYKVDVCEKTEIPYVTDPTAFLLLPKNGIYLKLMKI